MALSDARCALMSPFRFPFWPGCQARKVLVSAPRADLCSQRRAALPAPGCAVWVLRLSRAESFHKCTFTPECCLLHSTSAPVLSWVFCSHPAGGRAACWGAGWLNPRSGGNSKARSQLLAPAPCSARSPFAKLTSFCDAASSFSSGLLFSRKPSGQEGIHALRLCFSLPDLTL